MAKSLSALSAGIMRRWRRIERRLPGWNRKGSVVGRSHVYLSPSCVIHKGAVIDSRIDPFLGSGESGGKISIGDQSVICPGAMVLGYGGTIELGNFCTVNPYTFLHGGGGIKIGDGARIGPHCTIHSSSHQWSNPDKPIRDQGMTSQGIIIGADVWIGAGVRIVDGVTVGDGAVIGAGAVVLQDIPEYSVAMGVPARVVQFRRPPE